MSWSGRLLHIHIAERASLAMEELDEAKLIAGRGIEGLEYPQVRPVGKILPDRVVERETPLLDELHRSR